MNQKLIRHIGRSQRLDILTTLKRQGDMTVKELATQFKMSYMGVKQHCLDLEKAGYLDTWRKPPTKSGRPEMLYRLTQRSQELFPGVNNPITLEVLDAVQQTYGPAAPTKILFGIFAQRTASYQARIKGTTLAERARDLARLRDTEGCMAVFEAGEPPVSAPAATDGVNGGAYPGYRTPTAVASAAPLRIVESHSPIEDLLRRYPILARLEKELFERVLNCPVRREEQSVPGVYRCTFYLG